MSQNANQKFYYFDLFKTIGTLIVFVGHLLHLCQVTKKVTTFATFVLAGSGHQVNDVFFFITGFLTVHSYTYQLTQTKGNRSGINIAVDFIMKRFYRLAPLMYVALFVQREILECSWNELISYLTFTHSYTNTGKLQQLQRFWYAQAQMQLFLITPLLFFYANKLTLPGRVTLMGVITLTLCLQSPKNISLQTEHRSSGYFAGIMCYYLQQHLNKNVTFLKFKPILGWVSTALFPVIIYRMCLVGIPLKQILINFWLCLFVITNDQHNPSRLVKALSQNIISQWISRYSYELYIVQALSLFKYGLVDYARLEWNYIARSSSEYWIVCSILFFMHLAVSFVIDMFVQRPLIFACFKFDGVVKKNPKTFLFLVSQILVVYFANSYNQQQINLFNNDLKVTITDESLETLKQSIQKNISMLSLIQYDSQVENFNLTKIQAMLVAVPNSTILSHEYANEKQETGYLFTSKAYYRGVGVLHHVFNDTLNRTNFYTFTYYSEVKDFKVRFGNEIKFDPQTNTTSPKPALKDNSFSVDVKSSITIKNNTLPPDFMELVGLELSDIIQHSIKRQIYLY
eukprot:403350710